MFRKFAIAAAIAVAGLTQAMADSATTTPVQVRVDNFLPPAITPTTSDDQVPAQAQAGQNAAWEAGWYRMPLHMMSACDKTLVDCLAFLGLGRAEDNLSLAAKKAVFGKVIHLPNGAMAHPYNFALTTLTIRICSARGNCILTSRVAGISIDHRWRAVARHCLQAWGAQFRNN